ncbi:MAG: DUF3857 domain-containing protein [Candidatus Zixiibacteriota bacterium]
MGDGKAYRVIYRRIRVLNENGRIWSDVDAPFMGLEQEVFEINGRTILPNGTIINMNENNIFKKEAVRSKEVEFDQYSFSIPGVTDDCIIEYQIKYKLEAPTGMWIIQKEIPLIRGEYFWKFHIFEISPYWADFYSSFLPMTPNYLWLNCNLNKNIEYLPSLKEATDMHFTILDVPAFEKEPFMISEISVKSRLICYYAREGTPATYWGKEASYFNKYAMGFCEENKKIKAIIEPIKGLATDQEKIDSAYKWVQNNVLNLNYDSPEPKSKKRTIKRIKDNKDVNAIIKRGYASPLELSILFWDMLREMDIDAKIGFASDRSENLFVYEAKYWQFDASVVAIPCGDNRYKFYQPGQKYTIPGMVPWYFEGVKALVSAGDINFINVPFSEATVNSINLFYTYSLNDDFDITGTADIRLNGQPARDIRMRLFDKDSSEYNQILKDKFDEMLIGSSIDSFTVENYNDPYSQLKIKCNVKFPEIENTGDRILLKPFDYFDDSENPFTSEERKFALLFQYAMEERESAQINIPEGWK